VRRSNAADPNILNIIKRLAIQTAKGLCGPTKCEMYIETRCNNNSRKIGQREKKSLYRDIEPRRVDYILFDNIRIELKNRFSLQGPGFLFICFTLRPHSHRRRRRHHRRSFLLPLLLLPLPLHVESFTCSVDSLSSFSSSPSSCESCGFRVKDGHVDDGKGGDSGSGDSEDGGFGDDGEAKGGCDGGGCSVLRRFPPRSSVQGLCILVTL